METPPYRRGCKFCGIARREVDARIVYDDHNSVAFLDARPLFLGHCLIIPVGHYETITDLPKDSVGPLFVNARLVAAGVQKALAADGTFMAINNKVSQSVPHLHIHVVPRKEKDGLHGFFWPRQKYANDEAIAVVQNAIRRTIKELVSRSGAGWTPQ